MARIRKDLDGSVVVAGRVLKAGDQIPDGARVGGHLVEGGKAVGVSVADSVPVGDCLDGCKLVTPLTPDETAEADALGIPTDVHPERVRGALLGYQVGVESVSRPEDISDAVTGDETGEENEGEEANTGEDASETLEVLPVEPVAKRGPGRPKKTA